MRLYTLYLYITYKPYKDDKKLNPPFFHVQYVSPTMSAKSQEEIQAMNAKLLNLFYGASAKAGKPLYNAPCWNQFASTQSPSKVESFEDHFAAMHKSLAEAVQRTDPADPLANKMKANLEAPTSSTS